MNEPPTNEPPTNEAPMGETPTVTVVLPTFNEVGNIERLIEHVSRALAGVSHEILVMDDRSPDGTAEAVRRAALDHPQAGVVERQPPAGLTVSIFDGVQRARGSLVAWMDCDFSHPPELLPSLLAPIRNGEADVTCASRYVPGGGDERDSVAARWASVLITKIAQRMIDARVRDYTTGYVMAPRPLILDLGLHGDYGEYCIELLGTVVREGHRVLEVPYVQVERSAGESKTAPNLLGFVTRGWRYLATIGRLWWRRGSR